MSSIARALAAQQEQRRRKLLLESLLGKEQRNIAGGQESGAALLAGVPAPLGPCRSQRQAEMVLQRLHPTATFLAEGRVLQPKPALGSRQWRKPLPWAHHMPSESLPLTCTVEAVAALAEELSLPPNARPIHTLHAAARAAAPPSSGTSSISSASGSASTTPLSASVSISSSSLSSLISSSFSRTAFPPASVSYLYNEVSAVTRLLWAEAATHIHETRHSLVVTAGPGYPQAARRRAQAEVDLSAVAERAIVEATRRLVTPPNGSTAPQSCGPTALAAAVQPADADAAATAAVGPIAAATVASIATDAAALALEGRRLALASACSCAAAAEAARLAGWQQGRVAGALKTLLLGEERVSVAQLWSVAMVLRPGLMGSGATRAGIEPLQQQLGCAAGAAGGAATATAGGKAAWERLVALANLAAVEEEAMAAEAAMVEEEEASGDAEGIRSFMAQEFGVQSVLRNAVLGLLFLTSDDGGGSSTGYASPGDVEEPLACAAVGTLFRLPVLPTMQGHVPIAPSQLYAIFRHGPLPPRAGAVAAAASAYNSCYSLEQRYSEAHLKWAYDQLTTWPELLMARAALHAALAERGMHGRGAVANVGEAWEKEETAHADEQTVGDAAGLGGDVCVQELAADVVAVQQVWSGMQRALQS